MIKIPGLELRLDFNFYGFLRPNEADFHAPELLIRTARHICKVLKIMDGVPYVRISKIKSDI